MTTETGKKLTGPHISDADFIKEYSQEYRNQGSVRELSDRMNWQFSAIKKRFAKLSARTPALANHVLPLYKAEKNKKLKAAKAQTREAEEQAAAERLLAELTQANAVQG